MKQILSKSIKGFLAACLLLMWTGCEEDAKYRTYVYPAPEVTGMSSNIGFAGSSVSIFGTNFGNHAEAVKVTFGEIPAISLLSVKNNCIVVEVPEDAISGEVAVTVWTNTAIAGEFTVAETPTVTAIASNNANGTMVATGGDVVTITGTGLGTFAEETSVSFNGTPATLSSVTDTEIVVTAPDNFNTGQVILTINSLDITAGAMMNPDKSGDISEAFLSNYQQPFTANDMTTAQAGTKMTWATPDDWTINDAIKTATNTGASETCGGLNFADDENGQLIMQSGWGLSAFTNGKLYQTATLPKGVYTLTVDMVQYSIRSGSLYLAATRGGEIADIDNLPSGDSVLGCTSVTGSSSTACTIASTFTLTEVTEVSMGFVATFSSTTYFRATGMTLSYSPAD